VGNVLEVGSSIAINPKMTVGRPETKIEVHADGMALQTEDASFKQTVDGTEMTEMSLNGRTMTSLISLAGCAQSDSVADTTGSKFPTQTTNISIAGAIGMPSAIGWMVAITTITWAAVTVHCHSPMQSLNLA
jgi:hypothetical protein